MGKKRILDLRSELQKTRNILRKNTIRKIDPVPDTLKLDFPFLLRFPF